jgi:hypothetical protein
MVIMFALIGITGASLGYNAKDIIVVRCMNKCGIKRAALHNVMKLTAGVVGSYVGDLDDVGSIVGDGVGLIGTGAVGAGVTGAAVVGVNVGRSVTGDLVGAGSVGLWR